jgi:hypothetical protein
MRRQDVRDIQVDAREQFTGVNRYHGRVNKMNNGKSEQAVTPDTKAPNDAASTAGRAAGETIGGTVGAVIGAGVDVVAGAVAGGVAAAKKAAKSLSGTPTDPTAEHAYWTKEYAKRPYVKYGIPYGQYAPAFQYGWESHIGHPGKTFKEVEPQLATGWESHRGESKLTWELAKGAAHDAWMRLHKAGQEIPVRPAKGV